jgi:hypothetical protein
VTRSRGIGEYSGRIWRIAGLTAVTVAAAGLSPAWGQVSKSELAELRARGEREGWTFTVGENPATSRSLSELCGLVEPENWREGATFDPCRPQRSLPGAFDWRALGSCTPVRDQRSCGSCWAFATVGALECNILGRDGRSVDLSEQWLVSCNRSGWSCDGGWFAHAYHLAGTDACGGSGAVLERDFPYTGRDLPCDCPYPHEYHIQNWAYVGSGGPDLPDTSAIKQAILDHGPVSVAVYVNSAFQGYTGGIFNGCQDGTVNHAVVLVGWNDDDGVWIMRNSWGPGWGESGYMRILYGCSRIGYGACYVDYQMRDCNGNSIPDLCDVRCGSGFCEGLDCGGSPDCNGNLVPDECEPDCNGNGIPDDCDVASGFSPDCNYNEIPDECEPDCNGNGMPDDCDIAAGSSPDCNLNRVPDECDIASGAAADCNGNGIPDECDLYPPAHVDAQDNCADAELLCPGNVQVGTTAGATRDGSASCGGAGGAGDVWYYYQPSGNGFVTISLCDSAFDTVLSVHSGCPGDQSNQLVCNDNYCGLQSAVSLFVSARHDYWIRVSGAADASGEFSLVLLGPPCVYSAECNDNGIPDECEPDCNGNGVPDDCDIAAGRSTDLDGDGIPDECRLGDMNCDGAVNSFDIDPFVLAFVSPEVYAEEFPACPAMNGDINSDGEINVFDIDPFVSLLTRGE